ncbi:MAG: phosphodiester glycosidase family protein [Chloroflexi bacterium]|nr:phosphodiester glycosidase family protein [Chloroflexota bacterium]
MGILYLLADRYLIAHVEIADVSAYALAAAGTSATAAPLPSTADQIALESAISLPAADPGTVYSDDWNYQSETVSISIHPVTTGSGKDQVTYFVADVILNDATQLQSAFAEDKFGTNIIANTSEIAGENDAILAVNGDYYGFRTDGIVIRNGVIYRDQGTRIGLAFYKDGSMQIYDETQTTAQELVEDGVWNTLSFGPALIENAETATGFGVTRVDSNLGNHTIESNNPRTGVGIIADNHFVFVVVDGRSPGYSRGVSLSEFAQIFADLGCTDAYNIDGGGSSTMYFMGRVVNNPLGRNKERGTSDILFIGS